MAKLLVFWLSVMQILSFLPPAPGERFFQLRDHSDQNKYLLDQHLTIIHNRREAEIQLEKYGYLKCRVQRRRRSALMEVMEGIHPLSDKEVEADLPMCSASQVNTAIRDYQIKYKLPVTGILDDVTRKFMSTSRCGNADKDAIAEHTVPEVMEESNDNLYNSNSKNSDADPVNRRRWRRDASKTKLINVLTSDSVKNQNILRRTKYIKKYAEKYKYELLKPYTPEERQKRSIIANVVVKNNSLSGEPVWDGQKFTKDYIRWRMLRDGFSTRIPVEEQRASLRLAFRMWSEVIPIIFEEDVTGDINRVDIEIAFGRGSHQNCGRKFDGHGGEIAHSWSGRNVHFDDEEDYKSIDTISKDGIYLLRVAVHEIGHVLGLAHTDKSYSIMYAIYHQNVVPQAGFELGWEDRKSVQKIYGVCKGRFNTIFDWVRKRPDSSFIYNTYIFRKNHYWMYENHANRTRYGDPLYIALEWKGVPNYVDGYAHVWFYSGKLITDAAYFFKGELYYKYDSENDRVYDGWPRLITEDFGPKPDETEGIPANIDTVYFDMRDRNLYFFKGDMVYVYDPKGADHTKGCCVRKRKIWEEFPPMEGEDPLPSDLDVAYFSYSDKKVYFLKDETVWENVLFNPRQKQIRNSVKKLGTWYEKWYDVCDVRTMDAPPDGTEKT